MEKVNTILLVVVIVLGSIQTFYLLRNERSDIPEPLRGPVRIDTEFRQAEAMTKHLEQVGVKATPKVSASMMLEGTEDIKRFCENFLSKVTAGNVPAAFKILKDKSALELEELDRMQDLTERQLKLVKPRYGKEIAYEFVESKAPCQSVLKYTYIIKYEKHITRWRFYFYKPGDKWIMNSFKWDDKIDQL